MKRNRPSTLRQRANRRALRIESLEDRRVLAAGFFQGFEADDAGWFPAGGVATQVASGTNGIASQAGAFHAEVTGGPTATPTTGNSSAFTRWGGYTTPFPAGGNTTSIGIYLDMDVAAANDTRFDFSSAINDATGSHRRDFIFNGGFYTDSDATGSGPRFVISASNNSVGWPKNPGRSPVAIAASGWYTFQHRFYDSGGGVLAVDMSVEDSSGSTVGSWTLSDPSDIIGSTVGGNRYGWFANNQFAYLAVDNSFQSTTDTVYVDDDWVGLAVGTDPDGAGPATLIGFDAFATIADGIAAVADGGDVLVADGSYAEDITVDRSMTISGANAGANAGAKAGARGAETVLTGGFRLTASDVVIDGLTILDGVGPAGIGDQTAIYMAAGGTGHVIQNNILTGGGGGRGVLSTFGGGNDDVTIENNEIGSWTSGVFNQTSSNVVVRGNYIHDNLAGVANDFVDDVLIESNNFKANGEAVGTFGSTDLTVTLNDLDGNTITVAHYGGAEAVDAVFNWWGTVDPAAIEASVLSDGVSGDASKVAITPFLLDSVFSGNNAVFQGANGETLIVDTASGDFYFTDGGAIVSSGSGARVQKGKLKIHEQDDQGRKIDVKGSADGTVEVVVKFKGKQKKESFTLELSELDVC
ncbi:MAG: right-handed parallel beta-helix repeat-containing protein [Pirellulaceae bacterium]